MSQRLHRTYLYQRTYHFLFNWTPSILSGNPTGITVVIVKRKTTYRTHKMLAAVLSKWWYFCSFLKIFIKLLQNFHIFNIIFIIRTKKNKSDKKPTNQPTSGSSEANIWIVGIQRKHSYSGNRIYVPLLDSGQKNELRTQDHQPWTSWRANIWFKPRNSKCEGTFLSIRTFLQLNILEWGAKE